MKGHRRTLVALVGVLLGLLHFGYITYAAFDARTHSYPVADRSLRHPQHSLQAKVTVLDTDRSVQAAMDARGFAPSRTSSTCAFGPGLSSGEAPMLLVGRSPWGWLAEIPRKGVVVLEEEQARRALTQCRPLERR